MKWYQVPKVNVVHFFPPASGDSETLNLTRCYMRFPVSCPTMERSCIGIWNYSTARDSILESVLMAISWDIISAVLMFFFLTNLECFSLLPKNHVGDWRWRKNSITCHFPNCQINRTCLPVKSVVVPSIGHRASGANISKDLFNSYTFLQR